MKKLMRKVKSETSEWIIPLVITFQTITSGMLYVSAFFVPITAVMGGGLAFLTTMYIQKLRESAERRDYLLSNWYNICHLSINLAIGVAFTPAYVIAFSKFISNFILSESVAASDGILDLISALKQVPDSDWNNIRTVAVVGFSFVGHLMLMSLMSIALIGYRRRDKQIYSQLKDKRFYKRFNSKTPKNQYKPTKLQSEKLRPWG